MITLENIGNANKSLDKYLIKNIQSNYLIKINRL